MMSGDKEALDKLEKIRAAARSLFLSVSQDAVGSFFSKILLISFVRDREAGGGRSTPPAEHGPLPQHRTWSQDPEIIT